jgi:hypothetical protein
MESNESKPAHTPEPWHTFAFEVYDENKQIIADCGLSEDYWEKDGCQANAARIVACVNYCKGANNEELEKTTLLKSKSQSQKLVRALNDLVTCVRIFQLKNNQSLDWEEFKYAESVLSDCQELDKNARDFFEDENQLESQRNELLAALKEARGYIQGMLGRKRSTFLDEIDAKIRNAEKGVGE